MKKRKTLVIPPVYYIIMVLNSTIKAKYLTGRDSDSDGDVGRLEPLVFLKFKQSINGAIS